MTVTVNNVQVDFNALPNPLVTFLQGADMDATTVRDNLRIIETSDEAVQREGSPDARGFIVKSSGNEPFDENTSNAITVVILVPFIVNFEAGPVPYVSTGGNLLSAFKDSPGAIVQINNAVGATSFNSPDIEYSSFGGAVTIDVLSSFSGQAFPTGTPRQPVNNLIDALQIASDRGFIVISVIGDLTVTAVDDISDFMLVGQSSVKSNIHIDAAATALGVEVRNASITGTLDGDSMLRNCTIGTLTYVEGSVIQCLLEDAVITLGNNTQANFLDCWSGVAGMGTPTIDCGGAGSALTMRGYAGGIKIQNKTGPEAMSFDFLSGQLVLDSTVTNGQIVVRGVAQLTDNSTGSAVVLASDALLNTESIGHAVWEDVSADHDTPGTMGYWVTKKLLTVSKFLGLK